MPTDDGMLTVDDVAERRGIKASTWRSYVNRKQAPESDGTRLIGGALRPVWKPETIEAYEQRLSQAHVASGRLAREGTRQLHEARRRMEGGD